MKLILELEPFPKDQYIVVSTVRVRYKIIKTGHGCSSCFSASSNGKGWQELVADGDYKKTNAFINYLQDARVANTILREYISQGLLSYWQFLPSYIWPQFFLATQLVDLVSTIFETNKPSIVEVRRVKSTNNIIWIGVVRAVAELHGVRVILQRSNSIDWHYLGELFKLQIKRKGLGHLVRRARKILLRAQSKALSFMRKGQGSKICNSATEKTLLCVTQGRRYWQPLPNDPEKKYYDEQFYPILNALRDRGWNRFLLVDTQDVPQNELNARFEGHNRGIAWRQYSSYQGNGFVDTFKTWCHFSSLWKVLKNDPKFLDDFRYKGVSLMPALGVYLSAALHDSIMDCHEMLGVADVILNVEKPAAVLLSYETGPWQRAIIIRAAARGIPTIGLQHGMIFNNHYDYMHSKITTDPFDPAMGFIVPKVTCVWGKAWKESLVNDGNYPKDAVTITGHWRYDKITPMRGLITSGSGSLAQKKIVAILSGGFEVLDYIEKCINVLNSHEGFSPKIKLHPSDNLQLIKQWLANAGHPETLLYKQSLTDLLEMSDIVICQFSTTLAEALLIGKPVILANFSNAAMTKQYTESGACLYAIDSDELSVCLDKVINDQNTLSNLEDARQEFVSKYYYKLDGCAAQRVADVLDSLL